LSFPDYNDMKQCVLNEIKSTIYPEYPCRINFIEIDQKSYLLTAMHCLYEVAKSANMEEMQIFIAEWKIPGTIMNNLNSSYINIENDLILIEINDAYFKDVNSKRQPFKVISQNYNCDIMSVRRVSCCCAFDCAKTFVADVTTVEAKFIEVNHMFYKGESGCLCRDSLYGNNRTCLFVNSHREIKFQPPTQHDWNKYMTCVKYNDIISFLSENSNIPSCNDLYQEYQDNLRLSFEYQLSKLAIFNFETYFQTAIRLNPISYTLPDGRPAVKYIIDDMYKETINKTNVYRLSLEIPYIRQKN